jgi:hypothetical protein
MVAVNYDAIVQNNISHFGASPIHSFEVFSPLDISGAQIEFE